MKSFLPRLLATITRTPRYKVTAGKDFEWNRHSWTQQIFRSLEVIFGRGKDIQLEKISVLEKREDGTEHIWYVCYTFEAVCGLAEQYVREFLSSLKLTPFKIYIPILQTTMGIPLLASPYVFAIAFDATTDSTFKNNTTPWSFSHSCTGSNLSLAMMLYWWSNSNTITVSANPTYNSVASTFGQKSADSGNGSYYCNSYYLGSPATGSNTASVGFSANSYGHLCCISFSGSNSSSPLDTTQLGFVGAATSMSTNIVTNYANSYLVDITGSNGISSGIASSQTNNYLDTTNGTGSSRKSTTTAGTYAMAWSWTNSTAVGSSIIAIRELAVSTRNSNFLMFM